MKPSAPPAAPACDATRRTLTGWRRWAQGARGYLPDLAAFGVALLFGARPLAAIVVGVTTAITLWLLFDKLLDLPLPNPGAAATTRTSTPKSFSFFSIRRLVISSVSGDTVS